MSPMEFYSCVPSDLLQICAGTLRFVPRVVQSDRFLSLDLGFLRSVQIGLADDMRYRSEIRQWVQDRLSTVSSVPVFSDTSVRWISGRAGTVWSLGTDSVQSSL
jgi:hypothetical protein